MTFRFSGTLMRFVDFEREREIAAPTVAAALDALVAEFPALRNVLYTASGSLRTTHRLFLNGEQLMPDEIDRPVSKDDTVEILTAIAGG